MKGSDQESGGPRRSRWERGKNRESGDRLFNTPSGTAAASGSYLAGRPDEEALPTEEGGEGGRPHRGRCPGSNPRLGSTLFSPWFPEGCSHVPQGKCSVGGGESGPHPAPLAKPIGPLSPPPGWGSGCRSGRVRTGVRKSLQVTCGHRSGSRALVPVHSGKLKVS